MMGLARTARPSGTNCTHILGRHGGSLSVQRLAAIVVLSWGCGGGNGGSLGPCSVEYDEPLFTVASARDARTAAPIPEVVLRDYLYDRPPGPRPPLSFLTDHLGLEPTNVRISAGELVCNVACTFGAGEGWYTFTFGAAGYRDTTVTVLNAAFSRSRGSCPKFLGGTNTLTLQLTPR